MREEESTTKAFDRPTIQEMHTILATLEHRPLTDRVRVALTLVKELESRMERAIQKLEAVERREDPWGYL